MAEAEETATDAPGAGERRLVVWTGFNIVLPLLPVGAAILIYRYSGRSLPNWLAEGTRLDQIAATGAIGITGVISALAGLGELLIVAFRTGLPIRSWKVSYGIVGGLLSTGFALLVYGMLVQKEAMAAHELTLSLARISMVSWVLCVASSMICVDAVDDAANGTAG